MPALSPEDLGKRLRAAREARQLEQKHLAAATGKTQSYISRIERGGVVDPSAFIIRDLEESLGVYHGYLTEPHEVRLSREQAINKLIAEYGPQLKITGEEELELRLRLAYLTPGPNPPMIYLVKTVELVRTIMAMEKP